MVTKIVLPILAVAGCGLRDLPGGRGAAAGAGSQPIVEPPTRPDSVKMIAGSGLVEARRENIPIGVNIPGVVTEVFVKKGEKVKAGAPLFRTDDREFKSMLAVREAELAAAKAQLHKLIVSPRPEDIPPAKAAAEEAEARMDDAEAALARTERLFQRQMIAASDYDKDRYAYLRRQGDLRQGQGRPRESPGRELEGRHRDRPGRRPARPEPGRQHQDQPRAADRPRPDGWGGPPAQRPARASSPP